MRRVTTGVLDNEKMQAICEHWILELFLNMVFRPLPASNITAASLFRAIEKYKPTLLLDEADTFLHNNDEMKGIINSGYGSSSSYVIRTVGDDFETKIFNTFGPKAIAQIDTPQETIMDRGIIIEMRRKKPDEKSERLRSDRIFEELKHLRQRLWIRRRGRHLAYRERISMRYTTPQDAAYLCLGWRR